MSNRIVLVFTILLVCQLLGEVMARLLLLPLPGPVIGMVILFIGLAVYGRVPDDLSVIAGGLLQNLSLLFVPAGVGVMLYARLMAENWLPLSVAVVASALITIVVTGLVMNWTVRLTQRQDPNKGGDA